MPDVRQGIKWFQHGFLLWISALLFAPQCLTNGKELPQYGIRHFDRQNGLSASSILEVYQTRDGYLWAGTYDGLNRFNGIEFVTFDLENTPSLPSQNITSLYQTHDGTFWVGTLGKGVKGYQDSNLTKERPNSFLPDKFINDLLETPDGRLIAATRKGLFVYHANDWSAFPVFQQTEQPAVQQIVVDDSGHLIIATEDGIFKWDETELRRLDLKIPSNQQIQGFIYQKNKGLWIGTLRSGIYNYNNGTLTHYTTDNGLLHNSIGDLCFDNNGDLWIGGREGVSILRDGVFSHYPMKGKLVYTLQSDAEGGMWVGTYLQGLFRFGDSKFLSYTNMNYYEESIIGRAVIKKRGKLLVGTNLGIFILKDGYLHPSNNYTELKNTMIRSMAYGANGAIWVATHTAGIARINADDSVIQYGLSEGLNSITNRCILQDSKGIVWIAGNKGLQFIKDGKIQNFPQIQGFPVLSINELHNGNLFVATDSDGFYIIGHNELQHYTKDDGLKSNIVFYAHEDKNDDLWITFSDGGIAYLHAGKIKLLDSKDGIPNDSIFYIQDDGIGHYWLACNSGIYSIEEAALRARAQGSTIVPETTLYDIIDGITSGGVTSISHPFMDDLGVIWFPSTQGVVSVNPSDLYRNSLPPHVTIESFKTETLVVSDLTDNNIVLPAETRRVTFNYAGLSFESGEKTKFRVMMEGFDKEFIEIENRREYAYTNLPPGKYTFRVNAAVPGQEWSEQIAEISFTLKAHFYQTGPFILLCGVITLLLIWGIVQFRFHRSRKQQLKLELLVTQKTADLKKAIIEAEEANLSKSHFLASVSHEVRNPMNGIVGIAELLHGSNLDPDQQKYVKLILNNSHSLLTMLNDLLDYSKLDSHKLQLERIPFSVTSTIDETLELQKPNLREKALKIETIIDPQIPEQVIGDPLRHRQILSNLISNAIKFTEKGTITIHVKSHKKDDHNLTIHFSVHDTGIGISKEAQTRLFQAYEQAEESTARNYGGTGLGLAICRSLVEMMNGEIWVESEWGKGSTFHFTTVVESCSEVTRTPSSTPAASKKSTQHSNTDLKPLQILLVDDEKMNLQIATLIFKKLGHDVECTTDPYTAIEKLRSTHFDLLFLDYYMPEIDGATFAKRISKQKIESRNPNIYMVATTGATSPKDHEKLRYAGFQSIVNKPLSVNDLDQVLKAFKPS